jgi:hypothetical protein
MICRLTARGWVNFTGSMGHGAMFKDGVSVLPLTPRQIARIGSTTTLVNDETGEQVGPSVVHKTLQLQSFDVPTPLKTNEQQEREFEFDREKLAAEEAARKEAEAKALEDAQAKAQAAVEAQVIYTRSELEAIAGNDGINALRAIAKPLNVKGRAIGELVTEILKAQAKLTVAD